MNVQVVHDGLNCKQYQDRMSSDCDSNDEARRTGEMLNAMIDKGEAMKCPLCQVYRCQPIVTCDILIESSSVGRFDEKMGM